MTAGMPLIDILIADDEESARFALRRALSQPDYKIEEAADGASALRSLRASPADLVFLDLKMPGLEGLDVLRQLGPDARRSEIIILTANNDLSTAVECIRLGAADYVTKPYEVEQVRAIARRVIQRLQLQRQVTDLQAELDLQQGFGSLIGASRSMRDLFRLMQKAAGAPVDLMIRGETGAGKELIAREIHRLSPRASGPFIAVNTAAIPESLMESEFFGHVRGAFTGADSNRVGLFEQAHTGTLFLDEIGDMPLAAQPKILRALQERMIHPVGAQRPVAVDVRIITATHQDLEQAIIDGGFRQDLFYRLRGVELRVPPLRSRRDDVLVLANHFLDRSCSQSKTPRPEFAPAAIDALLEHSWPGNVRELEQTVIRGLTMCEGAWIQPLDLGLSITREPRGLSPFSEYLGMPLSEAKSQVVEELERTMISAALQQSSGNISEAARLLGMHRQSLQQKMAQLGIRK